MKKIGGWSHFQPARVKASAKRIKLSKKRRFFVTTYSPHAKTTGTCENKSRKVANTFRPCLRKVDKVYTGGCLMSTEPSAKAAADFLFHLGGADIPFSLVVGERDVWLAGEGQDAVFVFTQAIKQVAAFGLFRLAASAALWGRFFLIRFFENIDYRTWHFVQVQEKTVHRLSPHHAVVPQPFQFAQQVRTT